MNRLEAATRRALADLASLGARAALVGGLAVSARCEPRTTRDADLAVAVEDDSAAEKLVFGLRSLGYAVLTQLEQDRAGRLATVRLSPPPEVARAVVLDLLFASSGIEPEVVARADPLEIFPELTVPVASLGDLIALKILSRDDARRPQDRVDLHALLAAAKDDDRRLAKASLELIAARGFNRDRDLIALLDAACAEFSR